MEEVTEEPVRPENTASEPRWQTDWQGHRLPLVLYANAKKPDVSGFLAWGIEQRTERGEWATRYSFDCKSACPDLMSTGTETCSWMISHLLPIF